jgi:proteasome activator subunit 4
MQTLVVSTKNERGYSSTGRLVGRVLAALTWVYALDQRFVNSDEWESESQFKHALEYYIVLSLVTRSIQPYP